MIVKLIQGFYRVVFDGHLGMAAVMNNLRIFASLIGLTICLMSSVVHGGSFIIELKNGREVTTSHVWEEGDEIKFYAPQGIAGFPKTLVKHIKPSTLVSNDKSARSSLPPSASHATPSTTHKPSQTTSNRKTETLQDVENGELSQEQKLASDKSLKTGEAQACRAKKLILTSRLDDATNKYLAASGARNPDAKQAALDDMREFSKKIIDLGDEVKKKNGGVLPEWWNE
jgi:hypothetical protein